MTYKEEDEMKRATLNHTCNVKKAKGSEHPVQSRKDIDWLRSQRILIRKKREKRGKKKERELRIKKSDR